MKYRHDVFQAYLLGDTKFLNDEIAKGNPLLKLLSTIEKGASYLTACLNSGISEANFYFWKNGMIPQRVLGELSEDEIAEAKLVFLECVKKADAVAEIKAIEVVKDAMTNHWQAAAWYLERKHPDRWSGRLQVEMSTTQIIGAVRGELQGVLGMEDLQDDNDQER